MLTPATLKRLLPTRHVCLRYGISSRTVRRWEFKKVIPPPDLVVNERKYWRESTLDENDRRIVAARGASAK